MSARYLSTNFYNTNIYIYILSIFVSQFGSHPIFSQTIVIFFFPKLTNTKWAAGFSKVPWEYPSRTPMYTSSFWEQRDILEIFQQRHPSYLAPMQLWESISWSILLNSSSPVPWMYNRNWWLFSTIWCGKPTRPATKTGWFGEKRWIEWIDLMEMEYESETSQ